MLKNGKRIAVLGAALVGGIAMLLCFTASGRAAGLPSLGMVHQYSLAFFNTHTYEDSTITFHRGGYYDDPGMESLKRMVRDHRSGREHEVDPDLVNLLYDLKLVLEKRHPGMKVKYNIISGYRAPETNAMLRAAGGGQAKDSRHMHGDAMDIRVPGIDLVELRNTAWCLQRGGVGFYKGSNFVHVDTDRVRYWNWKPTSNQCAKTL